MLSFYWKGFIKCFRFVCVSCLTMTNFVEFLKRMEDDLIRLFSLFFGWEDVFDKTFEKSIRLSLVFIFSI